MPVLFTFYALRLIARAKAQEVKKTGVSLTDRMMGNPDLIGKLASWTAPIANWANENKVHHLFMQGALGIHKDKKLPPFAWKTFVARFRESWKAPAGEPVAKIAFFSTCFVNYNRQGLSRACWRGLGECGPCVVCGYK